MKMHELLDSPEKWTKGVFARNELGREVEANSPCASCWCLLGAMHRCYATLTDFHRAYRKLVHAVGAGGVSEWNDAPDRMFGDLRNMLLHLDI